MGSPRMEYAEVRDSYLFSRGWELRRCPKCSGGYFTKKGIGNCGSYTCNQGYTFTGAGSPRQPTELEPFTRSMAPFFVGSGYDAASPFGLVRVDERTLFASAAGQVFDTAIYEGHEPESTNAFVIQPVIRLKKMDQVGVVEGFATSFLNAATEVWHASPERHIEALDRWLDFFSACRLYVGNLCLKISQEVEDWDGRTVQADSLKINYGGLEVAIVNFFSNIKQPTGEATLSDISLGVERLIWAINKTGVYFDAIGPLDNALKGRAVAMDTVRTLTLMASAGVVAGHKNHGYQFHSVAKSATEALQDVAIRDLVAFYYTQWARYLKPECERNLVEREIMRETDRNANLLINEQLGTSVDCNQPREGFLRALLRDGRLTTDKLRASIGKVR